MVDQVLETLRVRPDGRYVDGTFGRGGHSRAILARLSASGRLFSFDQDPEAVASGQELVGHRNFELAHARFSDVPSILHERGLKAAIDGILLDLGISSPQLDTPKRGFSFRQDGPLDMRMDPTRGVPASHWLNGATEAAIRECLWHYGEERRARQIAARICQTRVQTPIETTRQLAALCGSVVRHERRIDPATRTFQALRIFVNDELAELKRGLERMLELLALAGRLVVISFHSLEDRLVKRFFRDVARETTEDCAAAGGPRFELAMRRSLVPSESEIERNPRARSARLRALERVA
jgi:16S rRNA (cytosine1402-N4)-methyltransferase